VLRLRVVTGRGPHGAADAETNRGSVDSTHARSDVAAQRVTDAPADLVAHARERHGIRLRGCA
jgi:hypothetical protein